MRSVAKPESAHKGGAMKMKRTARCAHVEEGECVGRGRVDRPLTSLEGIRGAASFTRSDPSLTCETQSPFYGDEFLHLKAEPLHG